jgi:capsular exopolysaccharide synthesis family protein
MRELLISLVLGSLGGFGLAFLLSYLNNTIVKTEWIEQLGIALLGTIPNLKQLQKRDRIASTASKQVAVIVHEKMEEPANTGSSSRIRLPFFSDVFHKGETFFVPPENSRTQQWESYRFLLASLMYSRADHPPRRILFTSPLPGEGKSTTVANLGIVMANTGAQTLTVDLDLRAPSLRRFYGLAQTPGISAFLSGNSNLLKEIKETAWPNLYHLDAGTQPPNSIELLGSDRLLELFKFLAPGRKQFILIDSPPVLVASDAVILSSLVDGVVLVAREGKTPVKAFEEACLKLEKAGAKILGAVLNDLNLTTKANGYYPYYSC